MAGIPVPGSRRRSGPPAPGPSPAPGAGHPPSKRARGFPVAALDPEDPFGAHGDFTADDLEELDTLASQALSQYPATTKDVSSVHKVPRVDGMSKHKIPAGKGRESMPVKDNFELEVLQAQHRELRQKLKIMEEEVLIKNGEIKILRDTLHQTESILEEQRRSHLLLEQERTQALSDKEKEFSKKLQSLQSELQFKDAEMNELRTKLQSSERANKPAAPSTSHLSPRKSPSMILRPEACSPLFGKTSFPTKESFSANMSLLHPCQTEPGYKSLVGREENKTCNLGGESTKQEDAQKILTDSKMQRSDTQGTGILARPPWLQWYSAKAGSTVASSGELSGVLKTRAPGAPSESRGVVICDSGRRLCEMERAKSKCVPAPQASQWTLSLEGSILINLLLKQPLIPGTSLGLCHLLSSCSEVPTGTLLQPPGFGSTLAGMSGLRTLGLREGSFSLSALREAQNLAFTGLNLVARSESSCDQDPAEGGRRTFPLCQLPGAVHLLPLVQFFIGLHCQALQDGVAAWRGGALGASPARPTCRSAGVEASPEDSLCSLEGFSVASLSVLQHLVCHSGAVVSLLLSGVEAESVPGDRNKRLLHRHDPGDVTSAPLGTADDQGQHPLWKMLLHLLAFSSTATGHLRASILSQSLKVLVKLAENAPSDLLPRFQCVFRVLPQCLSPETPIASALLTTELLSLLVDHEQLAPQLCSHSEGCLLLLLYMYITSRPDKVASERQWLQLEQEAVWLLAKLGMQSPSPVTGSDCQCNVEAVRALTVMLHRQWLSVRRAEGPPRTDEQKRTVRCLRDTLLLLHRLSQKDKLFSMHCVEVLHQYDQVMPGVSTLIRGLPDVTDCEEAALDDLCAAETDVDDLEMECA